MRTLTEQEVMSKRLREAREARFNSATDGWSHAKRFVKVSKQTYIQHENGTRGFKAHLVGYAKAFDVSPGWLLTGNEASSEAVQIRVDGRVAAGRDGDFYEMGYPEDAETVVFDPERIFIALDIEGDSMSPRYKAKEKVLFGYRHDDPSNLLRQEVFVQLKTGEKLFKILREGSRKGLWDLYSINPAYDPIRDVEIEWAAPVEWHKV